ncbi:MAG: hypothetical protein AB7U81_07975 [Thiohalomonadaceae bacterium]
MDLDAKVAFLRRPEAYPDGPARVDAVETHISWVFLTRRFAYKLKKPVRQPYLDFRTLDARHQDCLEEVRLNRRLAGDVYLGVLPLSLSPGGQLNLHGEGRTVDWLVHMRRLPAHRMLDERIRQGRARPADLQRVGECLAHFYRGLPPIAAEAGEYAAGFRDDIEENRRELGAPGFGLPRGRIEALCSAQQALLARDAHLLEMRVREGRIIEGHGDLRPEHVCLLRVPIIIDCLEFKRAFRVLDAADELGYLALECERLGAPWAGPILFEAYGSVTGDRPAATLVHFYQSVRATLRAKLAIWHNRDHEVRDREKWARKALQYLELAERHARAADGRD